MSDPHALRRPSRPIVPAALCLAALASGAAWGAAEMTSATATESGSPVTAAPERPTPQDASLAPIGDPDWHARERLTGNWWGARTSLSDRGIAIDASITYDLSKNLRGGVDTSGVGLVQLYDLYLTLDTERLLGLKGGTFFVVFQHQTGQSPDDEVGSYQGVSSIDADGRTQVSEAYYQQSLFDDRLTLKAGKIDATADFACSDFGNAFVGASMGLSPNIPIPTYPDSAFGASARWNVTEALYVGAGAYDGAAQEGVPTGSRGPKTLFGKPSDLFLIAQVGSAYDLGDTSGHVAVGAWHHTGTFDRFDGGTDDRSSGAYLLVDHTLYRENPDDEDDAQGLSLFALYGLADDAVAEAPHHVVAGAVYTGLIPTRDADSIGLAAGAAFFADGAGFDADHEVVIELFYEFRPLPFISLKPDLQYILNAGGADDAFVATLRAQIDL
jgi:porin